jgi:hypothetical protein
MNTQSGETKQEGGDMLGGGDTRWGFLSDEEKIH